MTRSEEVDLLLDLKVSKYLVRVVFLKKFQNTCGRSRINIMYHFVFGVLLKILIVPCVVIIY